MPIQVNLNIVMARRRMRSKDLAHAIGITEANLSLLKSGKVRGVRFSTLEALCRALDCQPGDLLEYLPERGADALRQAVRAVPRAPGARQAWLRAACLIAAPAGLAGCLSPPGPDTMQGMVAIGSVRAPKRPAVSTTVPFILDSQRVLLAFVRPDGARVSDELRRVLPGAVQRGTSSSHNCS